MMGLLRPDVCIVTQNLLRCSTACLTMPKRCAKIRHQCLMFALKNAPIFLGRPHHDEPAPFIGRCIFAQAFRQIWWLRSSWAGIARIDRQRALGKSRLWGLCEGQAQFLDGAARSSAAIAGHRFGGFDAIGTQARIGATGARLPGPPIHPNADGQCAECGQVQGHAANWFWVQINSV